jgi:hypothetical protein
MSTQGKTAEPKEATVDELEVEAYGKRNEEPPPAKRYRIRVDREHLVFEKRVVTGREILEEAGKEPFTRWRLHQKLHGGRMAEIDCEMEVDLGAKGIERFTTFELNIGDGDAGQELRRAFRLPEDDETYLDSLGLRWETIIDGGARWLLIHGHPLPSGYNTDRVTVAIRLEGGYPPGALDMAYLHPALQRADGRGISALCPQLIDGTTFQRWSRHYPWRPGLDSLATHHLRIKEWLAAELRR